MKLLIECYDSNSISKNIYYLQIIDINNKKIYSDYICNNYILEGINNETYKIIITNRYYTLTKSVIMGKCNKLKFIFDKYLFKFVLGDNKYDNLPIERGSIIIWQEHTQ